MSKILEKAFEQVKRLPTTRQDEFGEMIIDAVAQAQSETQLTPDQQEEVRRRMSDPHPIIASDEQVETFFRRFAV